MTGRTKRFTITNQLAANNGMYRLVLAFVQVVSLLMGGSLVAAPAYAAPASKQSEFADHFGYTWDDTLPFSWIDATSGTDVGLNGVDDASTPALNIGFEFPFYEHTYTQLFISTNGLITFGEASTIFDNKPIPHMGPPENFIAPFWDDLAVGGSHNSGKIYMLNGTEPGGRAYLAVQWNQVTRSGNLSDPLTFEAVLYEDGDICFQYLTLNGVLDSASIGIENDDGLDGSMYLTDAAGLEALEGSQALCYQRPAPTSRVKVLPHYASTFLANFAGSLQFGIRNTGEVGPDTYNLTVTLSGAQWPHTLMQADGTTPLTDTDGDGRMDTGTLLPGETFTVIAKIQAPKTAQIGEYTQADVTAQSASNPAQTSQIRLQSAISAPFAQIFTDSQTGMHLQLNRNDQRHTYDIISDFTGATLSLVSTLDGTFMYAWERNEFNGSVFYSDIEYVLIDRNGKWKRPLSKLTENSGVALYTTDHFPQLAATPGGTIGVAWVRNIYNNQLELNSNVYFALVDSAGNLVQPPVNVTQNNAWRGSNNFSAPEYTTPQITSTGADHFILTWVDDRLQSGGETSDIYLAAFDAAGNLVAAPQSFTQSVPGEDRYIDPNLTAIDSNLAFLCFSIFNPNSGAYQIAYGVVDSNANVLIYSTLLTNATGRNIDAINTNNQNILLAWTNTLDDKIEYMLLDGTSFNTVIGPISLNDPFNRLAENVSVTSDSMGHGIITWMDAEYNDYLYYALINPDGNVATPTMILQSGNAHDPQISTSAAGAGNAPYGLWQTYLPSLYRH